MAYDNQKGAHTGGHEGRSNSEVLWRSPPLTARIIFGAVLMLVIFCMCSTVGAQGDVPSISVDSRFDSYAKSVSHFDASELFPRSAVLGTSQR
jgi:hypothetical protein